MKKKGSALVLAVAVTALLTVLCVSLYTLSVSSAKANAFYDYTYKVRLSAEGGVQKGIAALNEGNIVVYTDHYYRLPQISFDNGNIVCNVTIWDNYNGDTNKTYIISVAHTLDYKYSKTISVVVTRGSGGGDGGIGTVQTPQNILSDIENDSLNVLGPVNFDGNPDKSKSALSLSNCSVIVNGTADIQGEYIKFGGAAPIFNNDVKFQGEYIDLSNLSMRINGDVNITGDQFYSNSSSIEITNTANVSVKKFDSSNGIFRVDDDFNLSYITLAGYPMGNPLRKYPQPSTYTPPYSPRVMLEIDKTKPDIYEYSGSQNKDIAFQKMTIDPNNPNPNYDFRVLNNKMDSDLNDPNKKGAKLFFIDGDYTISGADSGYYRNAIIYCTGTLTITNCTLQLSDSAIYAKRINVNGASFIIDPYDNNELKHVENYILDYCEEYLVNNGTGFNITKYIQQ